MAAKPPKAPAEDLGAKGVDFLVVTSKGSEKCFVKLVGTELRVYKAAGDEKPAKIVHIDTGTTTVFNTEAKPCTVTVAASAGAVKVTLGDPDPEKILTWASLVRAVTFSSPHSSMADYEILAVLGRGYYGKVQLCKRKSDGQLCAIKTIHKARLVQAGKAHTVFIERGVLARCHHPFIVQFFEAFQTSMKVYIVLEYAAGGELFHHLQRRRVVPVGEARLYIAELSLAINFLHVHGIVYRDLKPENVLLDAAGHALLTDFGLSKQLDPENSTTGTFCGTLEYLSPECSAGRRYGREVDWWAIGILTFELLFGQAPFVDSNKAKLLQLIRTAKPQFPKSADEKTIDFITHLLEKDPTRRGNFETIRRHPWMAELDFEKVLKRGYTPAFKPPAPSGVLTPNVDAEFRAEVPMDSLATPLPAANNAFEGFSCVAVRDSGQGGEDEFGDEDLGGLTPSTL